MKEASPARNGNEVPRLICRVFNLIARGEAMDKVTTVGTIDYPILNVTMYLTQRKVYMLIIRSSGNQ